RVALQIAPERRVIIPKPIVVQPGLDIIVMPWKSKVNLIPAARPKMDCSVRRRIPLPDDFSRIILDPLRRAEMTCEEILHHSAFRLRIEVLVVDIQKWR